MKCKVYHDKDPKFGFGPDRSFQQDFVMVAELEVSNDDPCGDAYHQTNSIDTPWFENKAITVHVKPCRSTSVGDVIELDNGERYLVMPTGWHRLDSDVVHAAYEMGRQS